MQISFREWNDSALGFPASAPLGVDEVQVWIAPIALDEAGMAEFGAVLNSDERLRAEHFRVNTARRQFVFGRSLLRRLLGACLDVDPVALAFGYQPRGKPFLVQPASENDLHFNLSHSGEMVAIAVTRGREIGVDIELIHHLDDWLLLAGRIFSPRELRELHSLPKMQQREAFFNGWTRKEACLKAMGEGLTDDLQTIEVTLTPGQKPELLRLPDGPEAASRWDLHAIPLAPDYAGAVVFQNDPPHLRQALGFAGGR